MLEVKTLGPYKLNSIITGDAKALAKAIPDESIDLIFTDPIYENMTDYEWLAKEASRVLKPNKSALIWCGIGYLPKTIIALNSSSQLQYKWQFVAGRPRGFPSRYCMNKVFSNWQSLLWFEKGKSWPIDTISDLVFSNNRGSMMYHNKWAKNINPFLHWLARFTCLGDVIFDPFVGGGTVPVVCKILNRNYIAFEIEPDVAAIARERVANTQPPLIITPPKQLDLLKNNAGSNHVRS